MGTADNSETSLRIYRTTCSYCPNKVSFVVTALKNFLFTVTNRARAAVFITSQENSRERITCAA